MVRSIKQEAIAKGWPVAKLASCPAVIVIWGNSARPKGVPVAPGYIFLVRG